MARDPGARPSAGQLVEMLQTVTGDLEDAAGRGEHRRLVGALAGLALASVVAAALAVAWANSRSRPEPVGAAPPPPGGAVPRAALPAAAVAPVATWAPVWRLQPGQQRRFTFTIQAHEPGYELELVRTYRTTWTCSKTDRDQVATLQVTLDDLQATGSTRGQTTLDFDGRSEAPLSVVSGAALTLTLDGAAGRPRRGGRRAARGGALGVRRAPSTASRRSGPGSTCA
jgi:hypothetical protein